MAKKKKSKVEDKPTFRSLLGEDNKLKPARELFSGFEIEKRFLILTYEADFTKKQNGISMYHEALSNGDRYAQGYVTDMEVAIEMVGELGIVPAFKPNTIRLRKINDDKFILTLKDKKETKRREAEWELDRKTFNRLWKLTEGHRVYKNRLVKKIKGHTFEIDAFTDRYLCMVECEVKEEKHLADVPKMGHDVTTDKAWTNKALAK